MLAQESFIDSAECFSGREEKSLLKLGLIQKLCLIAIIRSSWVVALQNREAEKKR